MLTGKKSFHISFWLFICVIASVLILIYLMKENKGILPAFIPLIGGIIQITVAEKVRDKNSYYPTSIPEYLITNLLFFSLFIFVLYSLNDDYLLIKIGAFTVMTLVGIYTTFFLLLRYKQNKQTELKN